MVEHLLAKEDVASSSLVTRSSFADAARPCFCFAAPQAALTGAARPSLPQGEKKPSAQPLFSLAAGREETQRSAMILSPFGRDARAQRGSEGNSQVNHPHKALVRDIKKGGAG